MFSEHLVVCQAPALDVQELRLYHVPQLLVTRQHLSIAIGIGRSSVELV